MLCRAGRSWKLFLVPGRTPSQACVNLSPFVSKTQSKVIARAICSFYVRSHGRQHEEVRHADGSFETVTLGIIANV